MQIFEDLCRILAFTLLTIFKNKGFNGTPNKYYGEYYFNK